MSTKTINSLSINDSLMLQQIAETGEESLDDLMYDMHMSKGKLYALVENLKQKGFVNIDYSLDDIFISLSKQGKRALHRLWPNARTFA